MSPAPRHERGGFPARLGEILPGALERIGPAGLWREAQVRKVWPKAVGDAVAEHAWVRRLRGSVLEVGVATDTWATELRYLGATIVERVNELLGQQVVSEVTVRRTRR